MGRVVFVVCDVDIQEVLVQDKESLAIIAGEPLYVLPDDLYIPPQALKVFLQTFSGPLDLLLYLIKKQNLDILNIPIAKITKQYVEYLELMQELELDLASEYLVMASVLAEIKSRLLLPKSGDDNNNEETDPRAELIKRLLEYERYKQGAEYLNDLPRCERNIFPLNVEKPEIEQVIKLPEIDLQDLRDALKDVWQRNAWHTQHKITMNTLTVREKMSNILERLHNHNVQYGKHKNLLFTELLQESEGKIGIIVTFLAMLELLRSNLITLIQNSSCGMIYLQDCRNANAL